MKYMTMPGAVHIDHLGWKNWKVGGPFEKAGQPKPNDMAWIYRQLIARKRAFILMDAEAGQHNIVDIINVKIVPMRLGDRRLIVAYTYTQTDSQEIPAMQVSWGELLMMDDGPRLPGGYRRDFYTLRAMFHEWMHGREG